MQNKPFIATRELVVFPGVVTPIFIGRQSSLKSLEEAVARFDKIWVNSRVNWAFTCNYSTSWA